ncbi:MAG: hypothetical protein HY918_03085 [Candidatus Doudnabacteria bacterium]|nr:hypothetical protein [Candidatus Doudnabacteria bacterium]
MKERLKNKKQFSYQAKILLWLFTAFDFLPKPFEHKTAYFKRQFNGKISYYAYFSALRRLEEKGLIKIYKQNGHQFLQLTKAGSLESLFLKAQIAKKTAWDGKWRMLVFDIPEGAREYRSKIRFLLKVNGFKQVQKSVYINPYPLDGSAVSYLHQSGLDKYIRLFRIDETDSNSEFKKLFGLSNNWSK